ncbi:MAG: hypothetical protein CMJ83_10055 [Planctomycetes bacterium]|nr:hypothetical protein [Planctomycetota bacterium]
MAFERAPIPVTVQTRLCAPNGPAGPLSPDWASNAIVATVGNPDVCVVIIDEDTIDNGFSTIQASASFHGVTPDYLVNDDQPTEVGNPWLRWNTMFPGDVVVLPGGEVDDEGWFALPPNTPWSLNDYAEGLVPQSQLDPIPDVMPLRNHDLFALIGTTCVAVVYDSDISMNYLPIQGNLQGARYGRFAFTVLGVQLAGGLPESTSSTSLYDLIVRVEPPLEATRGYHVTIRDHEPDAAEIVEASWSNGTLTVRAESDFAPSAIMTLSVEDFVLEAPMAFDPATQRYEATLAAPQSLVGRRVTVSTDEGGAYNEYVQ